LGARPDPDEICRRHAGSILRRARGILDDPAEAEDAAQEILLLVMTKGSQFRGSSDPATWIYRLTTNVCLNRLRERRRRSVREHRPEASSWLGWAPSDPYERFEARATLDAILGRLDQLAQQVFVYRFLDGMNQEEIAEATGKSRRTVGKRLRQIEACFASRAEDR
jgi:RNA polymerase sigma-70 factor (ECF subfamily)